MVWQVGNQDQIYPSNVQSAASASIWGGPAEGPLGPGQAGPSSMPPMGGVGGPPPAHPQFGMQPANEPADQRYWDSLIVRLPFIPFALIFP